MVDVDKVCILSVVSAVDHDTIRNDTNAIVVILNHGDIVPVVVLHHSDPIFRRLITTLLLVCLCDELSKVVLIFDRLLLFFFLLSFLLESQVKPFHFIPKSNLLLLFPAGETCVVDLIAFHVHLEEASDEVHHVEELGRQNFQFYPVVGLLIWVWLVDNLDLIERLSLASSIEMVAENHNVVRVDLKLAYLIDPVLVGLWLSPVIDELPLDLLLQVSLFCHCLRLRLRDRELRLYALC